MNYVLVTGASTGIGFAMVEELISQGYHVFANVRTRENGAKLADQFGESCQPLIFDVTDRQAIKDAVVIVEEKVGPKGLFALINNAGIAVTGPLMHLPEESLRHQLEVNVVAVNSVTQQFLPLLGAGSSSHLPKGNIINISSISGRIAMPFVGAYAASKHALEALSDTLRRELLIYGIKVVVVEPGPIKTPIWQKAFDQTESYKETDYIDIIKGWQKSREKSMGDALEPDKVSKLITKILKTPHPKTRYVITPKKFMMWTLPNLISDRTLDRWVKKFFDKVSSKSD